MSISDVINSFVHDGLFQAVLVLISLDVLLGILAALKRGDFKFSWLAGFGKDDLLGKVVPWFVIYTAAKYAPNVAVLGIDLDAFQKVVFGFVAAALGGSLISSLKDLGLPLPEPPRLRNLFGGERQPPPEP